MAYKITDECISCGACEGECKNQAISEGETIYLIDPAKCTECVGNYQLPKCAEVCPVDACVPDTDHIESKEQLLEKWHKLHPGETPTHVPYRQKMSTEKIREIEERIADLKARWPAHSVPPSMWQQLEELEDELEKVRKAGGRRSKE